MRAVEAARKDVGRNRKTANLKEKNSTGMRASYTIGVRPESTECDVSRGGGSLADRLASWSGRGRGALKRTEIDLLSLSLKTLAGHPYGERWSRY